MAAIQYKVFDRTGKFIKNVKIGEKSKFKTVKEFEDAIKQEGLFAHRKESFENRPYWKGWTFRQKLENLGWRFGNDGLLINADW